MDFKQFLASGRTLLVDTKTPRKVAAKTQKIAPEALGHVETDPYKIFIKKVTQEKPKKVELVKEFKRFIEAAEAQL